MTPASHAERQSHVTAAARKVTKRRSLQGWTKGPGGEVLMKLAWFVHVVWSLLSFSFSGGLGLWRGVCQARGVRCAPSETRPPGCVQERKKNLIEPVKLKVFLLSASFRGATVAFLAALLPFLVAAFAESFEARVCCKREMSFTVFQVRQAHTWL